MFFFTIRGLIKENSLKLGIDFLSSKNILAKVSFYKKSIFSPLFLCLSFENCETTIPFEFFLDLMILIASSFVLFTQLNLINFNIIKKY